ncbi:MAG: alpha/beta fold hydrolase [Methanomicrobium sp.]|nr:alpha/beta fold hydrolase [Methanomicrobium sp.]
MYVNACDSASHAAAKSNLLFSRRQSIIVQDILQNNVPNNVPNSKCPVILVHGWKSSPHIWSRLIPRLEESGIEYHLFDHSKKNYSDSLLIADELGEFIADIQSWTGYSGAVDIVSHSLGTTITRYLLEVADTERRFKVRRFIGIGPVNRASTLAELFNDERYAPSILKTLTGVFVPKEFSAADDPLVQGVRFGGKLVANLSDATKRDDIDYRFIVAVNKTRNPDFFRLFEGKTWVFQGGNPENTPVLTYDGDGIVALCESALKGAGYSLLPKDLDYFSEKPGSYCHILLPTNREAIECVIGYLTADNVVSDDYFE